MRFCVSKNQFRWLSSIAVLAFVGLFFCGCGTTGVTTNQTTTAGTHLVELSWNPSSTSSVVKYNVYRSSQGAGPFDLLNSAAGSAYTDSTVQSGQTYYYAVTSVDSNGWESAYSNVAVATVPTP
jgi:fibronectin type 3 domain-containing protein